MSIYYPDEIIEEIRINNDIVDVVSEYVKLDKRQGHYLFGLCPFHNEKRPSFSVTPSMQIFYCFGCGKGGNVFQFIMNAENLEYIEAVKYLAERARIQLPEGETKEEVERAKLKQEIIKINTEAARYFYHCLSQVEFAREYLQKRGLSEQIMKGFGLGFATEAWDALFKHLLSKGFKENTILQSGLILSNKKGGFYDRFRGRIIFPIFDIRGNVIGFGGRVMDQSMPKYMNSPETLVYNKGKNLYGLNFAKKSQEKKILIVEGYMDVISLHQNGIINTVASLGTALTESQGRLLKKYAEEIIISYDADSAGQAATMRGLNLLNDIGCNVKVLLIPEGKDPDEYVRKNGAEKLKKLIDGAISLVEYKIKVLRNQINTETTDGKINFLNKVSEVLSRVENLVEREMYIKKIAGEYRISEEAILVEIIKKVKPKTSFKASAISANNAEKASVRKQGENTDTQLIHDERMLLSLLCMDNGLYKILQNRITPEDFCEEENKKVAKVVFERISSNKGIVTGELLSLLEKRTADDVSRIILEECNCDDNKKAVVDIIKRIELYKLNNRQSYILSLLNNPREVTEGDVGKLKQELSLIIMKKKSI